MWQYVVIFVAILTENIFKDDVLINKAQKTIGQEQTVGHSTFNYTRQSKTV